MTHCKQGNFVCIEDKARFLEMLHQLNPVIPIEYPKYQLNLIAEAVLEEDVLSFYVQGPHDIPYEVTCPLFGSDLPRYRLIPEEE